jgi:hypothetical protein
MTAKIVPIRGRELVSVIEEWLEQAKRGEITAMAFAAIMDSGDTCEGWAGNIDECTISLYGAVNVLRDGFFHKLIEHYSDADRGTTA